MAGGIVTEARWRGAGVAIPAGRQRAQRHPSMPAGSRARRRQALILTASADRFADARRLI